MGSVHEVKDEADFDAKLSESEGKIVIIDFSATWCGPCKMIGPAFKGFAEAHPHIVALKVDVDDVEEIAARYKIEAMPTFIVLKDKKEVERVMGASKEKVEALFTKEY